MALRDRVSSKKLQQLKQLRTQSNPALDISVRFFGLDWNALSEQLSSLLSHAGAVSDLLNAPERRRRDNGRGGGGGRKSEDARLLEEAAQLVVVMSRVQENLVLHAEAVLHGRINRQRNDIMR